MRRTRFDCALEQHSRNGGVVSRRSGSAEHVGGGAACSLTGLFAVPRSALLLLRRLWRPETPSRAGGAQVGHAPMGFATPHLPTCWAGIIEPAAVVTGPYAVIIGATTNDFAVLSTLISERLQTLSGLGNTVTCIELDGCPSLPRHRFDDTVVQHGAGCVAPCDDREGER